MKKLLGGLLIAFALTLSATYESQSQTTRRVQFARGASAAIVKGSLSGYKYIDYIVRIRAGQVLALDFTTESKTEMVIFLPSGDNMPDAAGITGGTMQIDETGDYTIRVLTSRAVARRKGAVTNFGLKIEVKDMQ